MRLALCCCLLGGLAAAQAIDSRTYDDLASTDATTWDLLAGQFPRHGAAWWEMWARKREQDLSRDPGDHRARNDLAVACLHLGRFAEAEELLGQVPANSAEFPWAEWNRGVLRVKQGLFADALPFLRTARKEGAIPPSPRASAYFVNLIAWRARQRTARPAGDPTGYLLIDEPEMAAVVDPLLRLVQDQSELFFYRADLATLPKLREGDLVSDTGFVRAWDMDPGRDEVWMRLKGSEIRIREIRPLLERARAWLQTFQDVEAELLRRVPVQAVDFRAVEKELEARGIGRFDPAASPASRSGMLFAASALALLVAAALGVFLAHRRRRRREDLREVAAPFG